MAAARIRLITRGDDSGSCRTANQAVRDAFEKGILRNTSIMVPGPTFAEAAALFKPLTGLCVGLHATLTDEWHQPRWGPVLGAAKVASLVMDDGTFFKDTADLWKHKPSNDEILAELKAQLDRARQAGLTITYMDTHMGFDWFHNLDFRLAEFARAEGLLFKPKGVSRLPAVQGDSADPVEQLIAQLGAAEAGKTYLVVAHPGYETDEMRAMCYGEKKPGEIARDRDWQRRLFMDERIVAYCRTGGVEPIRFTDLDAANKPA